MTSTNHKQLTSPAGRKVPVNVSLELRILDLIDELSFKLFGRSEGKRSETISHILKEYLGIK